MLSGLRVPSSLVRLAFVGGALATAVLSAKLLRTKPSADHAAPDTTDPAQDQASSAADADSASASASA